MIPWQRYPYVGVGRYSPNYDKLVANLLEELTRFRYRGQWIGIDRMAPMHVSYAPRMSGDELADTVGSFYREFAADVVAAQGVQHFLEKNTWNMLHFDKLLDLLPEAKLVYIHRDPRDVTASLTGQSWAP